MTFRNSINRFNANETAASESTLATRLSAAVADGGLPDDAIAQEKVGFMGGLASLEGAMDPVFTDTTYTFAGVTVAEDHFLRLATTGDSPINQDIRVRGGTNVGIAIDGSGHLVISSPNFSNVETYATTTARNAATDVVWHTGDVAIITGDGSSYFFVGTDQLFAATTADSDWQVIQTPSSALDAAGVLSRLYDNNEAVDKIDANLLEEVIAINGIRDVSISVANPPAGSVLTRNSAGDGWTNRTWTEYVGDASVTIASLNDVAVDSGVAAGQVLVRNTNNNGWVNMMLPSTAITVDDVAPVDPDEGDLWFYEGGTGAVGDTPRLFVRVIDEDNDAAWLPASPSPEVPNAPVTAASYALNVNADGMVSWEVVTTATTTLSKQTGRVTIVANQMQYNASAFVNTDGSSEALSVISPTHTLIYNGLVLAEGVDYTSTGTTITLDAGSTMALTAGQELILVNTILTVT